MFIVYINYINIDIPNCGAKDRVLIKIYYLINITKEKRGSKMQKKLGKSKLIQNTLHIYNTCGL